MESLKSVDAQETESDPLTAEIIGAAMAVHRALGPGLLESAYEACLAIELEARGIRFRQQVDLPIVYRDRRTTCTFRIDLLVDDRVIVELKAVDQLAPVHRAQLLTYLKLSGKRVGLLLNFNTALLKDGIKRLVL